MLRSQLLTLTKAGLPVNFGRKFGITSTVFQTDPIQRLFIEKIKEYKSRSDGGRKLVDPTAEIQRELKSELQRLTAQYGGKTPDEDMTKFPEFKFADDGAKLDPVTEAPPKPPPAAASTTAPPAEKAPSKPPPPAAKAPSKAPPPADKAPPKPPPKGKK